MSLTAPMVPGCGSSSSCQPSYLYGLLPQTGVSVCLRVCGGVYMRVCVFTVVCVSKLDMCMYGYISVAVSNRQPQLCVSVGGKNCVCVLCMCAPF